MNLAKLRQYATQAVLTVRPGEKHTFDIHQNAGFYIVTRLEEASYSAGRRDTPDCDPDRHTSVSVNITGISPIKEGSDLEQYKFLSSQAQKTAREWCNEKGLVLHVKNIVTRSDFAQSQPNYTEPVPRCPEDEAYHQGDFS